MAFLLGKKRLKGKREQHQSLHRERNPVRPGVFVISQYHIISAIQRHRISVGTVKVIAPLADHPCGAAIKAQTVTIITPHRKQVTAIGEDFAEFIANTKVF